MIELDGSFGEGGGQILRTSLSLSLITGKPFRLRNIRAKRPKPGLQAQHLMCVKAAAEIGQATTTGASLSSTDLVFEPGEVIPGKYHFTIGTAGATALVLHTVALPLALFAREPSEVVISGGTHVKAAPCFHFLETTWCPYMAEFGLTIKPRMDKAGFYPRGGGSLSVHIQPCAELNGLTLTDRAKVTEAHGLSIVADLPEEIAKRQADRALHRLKRSRHHFKKTKVRQEEWRAGPGTVLAMTVNTNPVPTLFFALGERGKKAERVADEALDQVDVFLATAAAVDAHSGDQLLLPAALAKGETTYTVSVVTEHLTTNVFVIRQFVEREIRCEGEIGKPGKVTMI